MIPLTTHTYCIHRRSPFEKTQTVRKTVFQNTAFSLAINAGHEESGYENRFSIAVYPSLVITTADGANQLEASAAGDWRASGV
jgi:hypothetical protein